jgi:hypothetical protein
MADFILIDGDKAIFLPNFRVAVVVVRPGDLKGSGPGTLDGKRLCVDGDETKVKVPDCDYTTLTYSTPGTGTLKIAALASDQKAQKTNTGGKPVLLKGGIFTAEFEVQVPAKQLNPPGADATRQYSGSGYFVTKNVKFRGT